MTGKIIKHLFIVFCFITSINYYCQSKKAIDSLTNLINSSPNDTNKVNLIFNLGRQYSIYGSSENINNFIISLQLAKKIDYKDGIKKISPTLINYLFYKGVYDVSMSYCLDYIQFLDKEGLTDEKFRIYNVLANLYVKQGDHKKALNYYNLAKNYYLSKNEMIKYSNVLININILFMEKKEYDSAMFYCAKALEIYKKNNNSSYLANALLAIGEIHLKKKEYENGKKRILESLDIYKTINEKHGICNCYYDYGQFYLLNTQNDSALKYFKIALAYSDTIKMDFIKRDCYENISKVYYKLNNFKEAYDYNYLFKEYSDSIAINNTKAKMQEMEVKYDITQKEERLKKQEYEINSKNKQRNYLVIIVVIILILFFIAIKAYYQKEKANSIIFEQKKIVENKQKEIIDSINYASRIQRALLPNEKYIEKKIKQ